MLSELYQTIEDRSNADYIKENGPFCCERKDAWLGKGYYYWDSFVENAHLWGKKIYTKNNKNYIACLSKVDLNDDVYDLLNPSVLLEFKQAAEGLSKAYPDKNITVTVVLEQLKKQSDFTYKAIRVRSEDDMSCFKQKTSFKEKHKAYLDTCPHIQVCVLDKTFIGENNFKIIFPSVYCDDYVI